MGGQIFVVFFFIFFLLKGVGGRAQIILFAHLQKIITLKA